MFFADLRGWTSFVDTVEPEESMRVLGEFHDRVGELVRRFDATVGFIEGDGVQLFFNDPIEVPDAALRAVRLGCALRDQMAELTAQWRKRGHDLDFGAGIALGFATCGEVGFEGRSDYAAIGSRHQPRLATRRRGDGGPDPDRSAPVRRGGGRRRSRADRRVYAPWISPSIAAFDVVAVRLGGSGPEGAEQDGGNGQTGTA